MGFCLSSARIFCFGGQPIRSQGATRIMRVSLQVLGAPLRRKPVGPRIPGGHISSRIFLAANKHCSCSSPTVENHSVLRHQLLPAGALGTSLLPLLGRPACGNRGPPSHRGPPSNTAASPTQVRDSESNRNGVEGQGTCSGTGSCI